LIIINRKHINIIFNHHISNNHYFFYFFIFFLIFFSLNSFISLFIYSVTFYLSIITFLFLFFFFFLLLSTYYYSPYYYSPYYYSTYSTYYYYYYYYYVYYTNCMVVILSLIVNVNSVLKYWSMMIMDPLIVANMMWLISECRVMSLILDYVIYFYWTNWPSEVIDLIQP